MPTLKEIRILLRKGVGNIRPRDIRENRKEVLADLEGGSDFIDDYKEPAGTGMDMDRLKRVDKPPSITVSEDRKDAIVHFGKYAGLPVSEIFKKDPSFVAWLINTFSKKDDAVSAQLVEICKYQVTK